ncbi:uncharacterized protein LOC122370284 [Amphibalanus amphitrite]|uniref:uncharacterized protein LOC122370284 n=1 Tax=Amphibalanus amphitrite TaxID=1232801 RepID=UPI001C9085FC|nr:uncharacterized protein LOC122370284 [Amphibalanus amphitrite]
MPCMTTCCCCFNTYQGSIIIGVLSLLPSITGVGLVSHLINTWDTNNAEVTEWAQNITDSLETSSSQISVVTDFIDAASADMYTVLIVLLIYFVGSSLTALMLISGVYQSMRCLMLPWLTVVLLRLLTVTICVGMFFYMAGGVPDSRSKERLVMSGLGIIPEIALTMYGWLCVFSHYHHLQLMEEQVAPMPEEEPIQVLTPVGENKY